MMNETIVGNVSNWFMKYDLIETTQVLPGNHHLTLIGWLIVITGFLLFTYLLKQIIYRWLV